MRNSVLDYMLFGKAIEVVEMVVEDTGKLDVRSELPSLERSNLGKERSEKKKMI